MNLKYDMHTAPADKHPQIVMRELGISYQDAEPQPIGDQWWFWGCTSIPAELPSFLSEMMQVPRRS